MSQGYSTGVRDMAGCQQKQRPYPARNADLESRNAFLEKRVAALENFNYCLMKQLTTANKHRVARMLAR